MQFGELDARVIYFIRGAGRQNFGDYLPEIFCQSLLTFPKVEADLFRLVGSVISDRWIRQDLRRANGHLAGLIAFWGCGARDDMPLTDTVRSHCLFFGVRGPLTHDVLGLPADTVLGDPGLLAPVFHRPQAHARTAGRTICVPHTQDPRSPADLLALSGADLLVHPEIPASEAALRDLLDQIASADFVLSASLHGAIIACAYGRPFAFWDNGHLDVPFKWRDFAGSIGMPATFVGTVGEGRAFHAAHCESLRPPPLAPILACCPFSVRPEALLRAIAFDRPHLAGALMAAADVASSMQIHEDVTGLTAATMRRRISKTRLVDQAKSRIGLGLRAAKRRLISR